MDKARRAFLGAVAALACVPWRSVRTLVARMDGTAISGFAPGAIRWSSDVPLLVDHDPAQRIGTCSLSADGGRMYAHLRTNQDCVGLFPSLGGRVSVSTAAKLRADGIIDSFEVLAVSVHREPNVDPHVPPIHRLTINQ